ncbi:MAG: hypothetical protein Q7I97_07635, partial [Thermovirgaceae bacterium]|nr:hypothetical protein [Thermovirgaceae bacterium]
EDSVQRIITNSSSFFLYPPFPLIYRHFGEVPEIVRSAQNRAKGLYFSGPIPFFIASSTVDRKCPWVYLPYDSTGLLVALLNASLAAPHTGGLRFSVDTVEESETKDVLRETNLQLDAIYALPYTTPTDPSEDFFIFHADLYRRGLTDFAITCVQTVKKALVGANIPTFTVVPALPTIRRTIQLLNLEIEKSSKDSMKVVVGIVSPLFDKNSPIGFDRSILSVHQALLTYSEKYNLLVVPRDHRSFRIIQNLGQLSAQTQNFARNEIYQAVLSSTGIRIDLGYGAGSNITIAEEYAEKALEMTRGTEGAVCYVIDGEKAIPIGTENKNSAPPLSSGEVAGLIKGTGMTVSSFTRYLLSASMLETPFSPGDFSRRINITKKAARKILSSLVELGVIEMCGKRHITPRGRPETLFRLAPDFAQRRQEIILRERG